MPPRVLLSSVFKPFAIDGVYGRADSKIELYHNQITKYQGVFSMRSFMNSFGLHAIANNIEVPTTVLDFPTLERFRREVKKGYDIVGIGSIMPNFQKAKRMIEETRELSPKSTVVLGGFCATAPKVKEVMGPDYVCRGEGISFMRDLLGLSPEFEFKNPDVYHEDREILGVPVRGVKYPHICVGLGCSYGCEFCSPSHFFGRKHLKFFTSGDALFEEMVRVKRKFKTNVVSFIGDDNFLLDRKRADELHRRVVESGEIFNIFLFGSADLAEKFGPERLAEMGVGLIWIGRESKFHDFSKNKRTDIKELVSELKKYGIKTILSSILLVDDHTRENIMEDVDEHIECAPAFSQFSLYAPVPGTPLYDRLSEEGRILTAIPFEEWHAFKQPWFVHPEFNLVEAEKAQERAYVRDFHELGPSTMRFIQVELEGWKNLGKSSKPHLRKRAESVAGQAWKYRAILRAIEKLVPTDEMRAMARATRDELEDAFGKTTFLEESISQGLFISGRVRQARTRLWGDALQPPTRVVEYNQ